MYYDYDSEEESEEETDLWYHLYTYQEYVFMFIGILCIKYFLGINLFNWISNKY